MNRPADEYRIAEFGPRLAGPPVVSVLMITYNHEAYIREAIESVLSQLVSFPVELVIGEDCSTDRTRAIIEESCADAPICVRLITSGGNVGMQANFRRAWNETRGELVALIEGDDCFIDPSKLEKQVSMLNASHDLSAVASKARIEFDNPTPAQLAGWKDQVIPKDLEGNITLDRILDFNFMIPTASVVIRKSTIGDLPLWLETLPMADWFLTVSAAMQGGIFLMSDCTSLYRVHATGLVASTSVQKFKIGQIQLLLYLHPCAGLHKSLLRKKLYVLLTSLIYEFEVTHHDREARRWLVRWMVFQFKCLDPSLLPFRWYARLRFPRIYSALRATFARVFALARPKLSRHRNHP